MEKEAGHSGYWQPVDRDRDSDHQGTAGNTEAGPGEQGTARWAHGE